MQFTITAKIQIKVEPEQRPCSNQYQGTGDCYVIANPFRNRGAHGDSPLTLSRLRLLSGKPPPLCVA